VAKFLSRAGGGRPAVARPDRWVHSDAKEGGFMKIVEKNDLTYRARSVADDYTGFFPARSALVLVSKFGARRRRCSNLSGYEPT